MSKNPKRPRDPNQLAKLITDIATGEEENIKPKEKDTVKQRAGMYGGKSRAKALTEAQRKEIAEKAAQKRWPDSDS